MVIWGFPYIGGPPVILHIFMGIFQEINQPAMGVAPWAPWRAGNSPGHPRSRARHVGNHHCLICWDLHRWHLTPAMMYTLYMYTLFVWGLVWGFKKNLVSLVLFRISSANPLSATSWFYTRRQRISESLRTMNVARSFFSGGSHIAGLPKVHDPRASKSATWKSRMTWIGEYSTMSRPKYPCSNMAAWESIATLGYFIENIQSSPSELSLFQQGFTFYLFWDQ